MNWPNVVTLIACILIAFLRIIGNKSEAFQALAHIAVGMLIGEALVYGNPRRKFCIIVVIVLSIIEISCFVVGLGKS